MEANNLIQVMGMQLWGTHGHYPEENKYGQKFVVDVEVACDMYEMCETDNLEAGLSYYTVYQVCKRVVTEEQHKLIQRVAQRIADEIKAAHPVEWVKVTVKKPFVPIGDILDYVAVTIVR